MPAPSEVYALVVWLEALGAAPHRTAVAALARLGPALARARLAHPAPGPGRAGAGRARPGALADRRVDPPGPGQRPLRAVGAVHARGRLARAGPAGRLGGLALPLAHGRLHPD